MLTRIGVCCCLLGFGALSAWAEDLPGKPSRELNVEEAVRFAFQGNRDLQLAEFAVSRAQERLKWAGRLQNPELAVGLADDSFGEDEGEGRFELAIRQSFPMTFRLRKEKALRHSEILLAQAEIQEHRRQLTADVEHAVIALANAQQTIAHNKELLDVIQEVTEFLQAQVERGESSSLDLTQARLTSQALEQQIRTTQAEARKSSLALASMMGQRPTTQILVAHELLLPEKLEDDHTGMPDILKNRPDYVLALATLNRSEIAFGLEKALRWQDITLQFSGEWEEAIDEPTGLEKTSVIGLNLSIPLPLWTRNEGGIGLAEVDRLAAEKEIEAVQFRILTEYTEAAQARRDTYEIAQASSGDFLALAEKNFAETLAAYEQGLANLFQVQLAQQQLIELKTTELEAIAAYHQAAAHLRHVKGDFPQRGSLFSNPTN